MITFDKKTLVEIESSYSQKEADHQITSVLKKLEDYNEQIEAGADPSTLRRPLSYKQIMNDQNFALNPDQITCFLKRAAAKGMIKKIDQYVANIPGIQLYEPEKINN